jgi:hypothetical protein
LVTCSKERACGCQRWGIGGKLRGVGGGAAAAAAAADAVCVVVIIATVFIAFLFLIAITIVAVDLLEPLQINTNIVKTTRPPSHVTHHLRAGFAGGCHHIPRFEGRNVQRVHMRRCKLIQKSTAGTTLHSHRPA